MASADASADADMQGIFTVKQPSLMCNKKREVRLNYWPVPRGFISGRKGVDGKVSKGLDTLLSTKD